MKADLVVTALATGFRHDVVLRERPTGPVEFRLPVRTEGLKLGRTEAGGLKLTDAKGKVVASAAEPFMTEAPSTDAKSALNTRGRIDAALVGKNGAQTLVIKPDAGFLADKDTTYPVTVDPTVSLTLARDVSVQSSSSSAGDATGSTLYVGSGTYLQAERRCSGSVCTTTNKIYPDFFRTYIDFGSDTGALAGKYVDSATLQLVGSYTGPCVGRTITASPITSSWLSVSYLRRPSTSATGTVTVTPSCGSNAVTSFNVTQMVKDWVTGSGFYGVELKSAEDSRSSWPDDPNPITAQYWSFNSTEAGQNPPKLSVNYLLPPEIPTVTGESIDSIAGNDAISRTSDVKVNYASASVDGKNIDYLVSISDPTTPIPVPTTSPSPDPSPSPTPTPSPSPSSTPFPGLVAAYGMNEGTGTAVGDQSGTGNAGTTSGTTWAAGKFGQALSFNGSSSMVTVPDSPSLRLTNKMTIEAWVKPSIATSWRSVLMKETSSSTSYGIYSNTTVGRTFVGPTSYLQIGGSVTSVSGPSALPTGTWSHIASTYDGSVIKTYLNGSVVAQSNVSGTLATSTGPLHMGGNGIWGEYYGGLIDEVRIYNGVLTQGQIQSDMNTAVGNTTTVDNPPSAPGTLNAVAGPDTVDLSWGAATDDHGTVTYQVHRSTTAGFTPTAATRVATVNGLTYSDSGMVQGQYYYRIVAVDNAGQAGAPSNEAAARTSAQLFPPVTGSPSGQVVSNEFKLGSPDSFKFKVKACLSGITPRPRGEALLRASPRAVEEIWCPSIMRSVGMRMRSLGALVVALLSISACGDSEAASAPRPSAPFPDHAELVVKLAAVTTNPGRRLDLRNWYREPQGSGYRIGATGELWSGFRGPVRISPSSYAVTLDAAGKVVQVPEPSPDPISRVLLGLGTGAGFGTAAKGDGSAWVLKRLPSGLTVEAIIEFKKPVTEKALGVENGPPERVLLSRSRKAGSPLYWDGDEGCAPGSRCVEWSSVNQFRSWVARLAGTDESNLRKFGLALGELRKAASDGLIYGVITESSPRRLREMSRDKNVLGVWITDMWPCPKKESCP
ncbi:LamG-like jellyroll fold domain-containing protein [Microbispora siamensis]|nr:LamG-like jellyroll fold domain-containing protein [Microbispora siamensis]